MTHFNRYGGSRNDSQRDRRLDFSRHRTSYNFSSSQQSQQSYSPGLSFSQSQSTAGDLPLTRFPPLPLCSTRSQISDDIEQRLSSLENLVAGIGESIQHIKKDIENQNLKASVMMREEEGTKRRLIDTVKSLEAKLEERVSGLGETLKNQTVLIEKLLTRNVEKDPLSVEASQPLSRRRPRQPIEVIEIESDSDTISRGMPEFEDLFGDPISADDLRRMKQRVAAARKNMKRKRKSS